MDLETLTNHIKALGKHDFDVICKLVIEKYYHKKAINVDGTGDGGADIIELDEEGKRTSVAYQLTVQKKDIPQKILNDIQKAVNQLGVKRFIFMTTYPLTESFSRTYEMKLNEELQVQCVCLGAKAIAGIIQEEKLEHEFLVDTELYIPRDNYSRNLDFRDRALHSYTLLSADAKNLREGIYDDTILLVLGEASPSSLSEGEIIEQVKMLLSLTDSRAEDLRKRLNSLQSKGRITKIKGEDEYYLSEESKDELDNRKKLYQLELNASVAAHAQLFSDKFNLEWGIEDTRKISTLLAGLYISSQFSMLEEAQVSYKSHPLVKFNKIEQRNKLYQYLSKKGVPKDDIRPTMQELLKMAAIDPLIQKVTRASMYVALEGQNPMTKAKGLGVNSWDDFDMLIDPSIALPCICSTLYPVDGTRMEKPVQIVEKCVTLGIQPYITRYYIYECAGHLLGAMNYLDIDLSDEEMQYSENIFVSLYYSLRVQNKRVPKSLREFLLFFSSQLAIPREDRKEWIRALMIDVQSALIGNHVELEQIQRYNNNEDCSVYKEYREIVGNDPRKRRSLFNHDLWALQHLNIAEAEGEKWIFLTYDNSLLRYGKVKSCDSWIVNPNTMSEFINSTQNLSDSTMEELILFASSASDRTLSIGARMIDKILEYASPEMQDWEFKKKFFEYKNETLASALINSDEDVDTLAKRLVEKFLSEQGKNFEDEELEADENAKSANAPE